jgi:diguanylate cyclase (GGDEF)-like protein
MRKVISPASRVAMGQRADIAPAEISIMSLDLPTLMVMQSFAMASAGSILLIAWLQNRALFVLALWGGGNILAAAGILLMMLGTTMHRPAWPVFGAILMIFQSGLMWKAARIIASKSAPLVLVLLGPAIVGLANAVPVLQGAIAASLSLIAGAAYFLATATSFWLGRKERLTARWPLIVLTIVQAGFYLIGAYSTLNGSTGQNGVPSIMSLFGVIYFESIIFALGTSVFILALIKERNEAAGRMAARIDPLTGIANRTGFIESAGRVLDRCRRDDAPVAVMMFDLDRFKSINDSHGHATGDAVIKRFCEIAAAALRPTDVFGRIGGEEFAVVLPGSHVEAAHFRAERIRTAFANDCHFVASRKVDATVSCGLTVSSQNTASLDALLEDADAALYCAKSEGRNRVKRADQPKPDGDLSAVIRVA